MNFMYHLAVMHLLIDLVLNVPVTNVSSHLGIFPACRY